MQAKYRIIITTAALKVNRIVSVTSFRLDVGVQLKKNQLPLSNMAEDV